MIYVIRILLCLCAASLLSACSSSPLAKHPTEWGYEKDAIQLHFTSDPQLNLYQKQAHSLIACIYHLKDLNGFNQLVDEKDGLPKLLECSRFDPSVTYSRRLVVQPGQEVNQTLDRTEGAKYLGLVAGYYSLHKEYSVRAFQIPVSMFNNPKKLNIYLHMGPKGIQERRDKK